MDHRQLAGVMLVADVDGDVVAVEDLPLVGGDGLLVGAEAAGAGGRHGQGIPLADRPAPSSALLLGRLARSRARVRVRAAFLAAALRSPDARLRVAAAFFAAALRLAGPPRARSSSSSTSERSSLTARRAPLGRLLSPLERLGEVVGRALAQPAPAACRTGRCPSPCFLPASGNVRLAGHPHLHAEAIAGMDEACHASASTPPTSRSRRAVCSMRCAPAEAAGFDAANAPTTSRPGASARASRASPGRGWAPPGVHQPVAGVRQCAGTALPPGDHRAGHGDAGGDVRPLRVALGSGEAANGYITGAAWPEKATRNARLRECVDVMRALAGEVVDHHGLVTVDRARLWTLPAEPPALVAAAVSETAGWAADGLGRRARDAQPAARAARARARGVPRRRQRGASRRSSRSISRGRRASRRRSTSPTASGTPTSSSRRSVGPPHRRGVRRTARASCVPRTCAPACSSPPTSAGTRPGCRTSARSASTRSTCTTWARSSARSSTRSGSGCSRSCDEEQGDQRPGGRTRSSTASTPRRSSTRTRTTPTSTLPGLTERLDYLAGLGVSTCG